MDIQLLDHLILTMVEVITALQIMDFIIKTMKIRCKHCGEFFCPSDESVELMSEGYISSDNVILWWMLGYDKSTPDDLMEMISDADPGYK